MSGHDWLLVGVGLMAFIALCRSHGKHDIVLGRCGYCGGPVMPRGTDSIAYRLNGPACVRCKAEAKDEIPMRGRRESGR